MGYGDPGSVPHIFFLREEQNVDVGILKLFLSQEQVNLSHVAQSSPFQVQAVSSKKQINFSHVAQPSPFVSSDESNRGAVPPETVKQKLIRTALTNPQMPWDTIESFVVQRRADTSQIIADV